MLAACVPIVRLRPHHQLRRLWERDVRDPVALSHARPQDGQAGAAAALPALDPAAAYQQYTSRWAELERRMAGGAGAPAGGAAEAGEDEEGPTLALAQLPWPLPEGYPYTLDNLREVLLAGVQVRGRKRLGLGGWGRARATERMLQRGRCCWRACRCGARV